MDIIRVPDVDDFSPLFRETQDRIDGDAWQRSLADSRRPTTVTGPQDVQALVRDIAPRHGVDTRLVEAVIGLESGGNPDAVSKKGAQGVMQLMPGTAKRFGVRDPMDAAQNIEGGIRYLAWLRDQFPGRTDLQLAGYHAGEGAVRLAGYAIPDASDGNMTTAQYVQTVLSRYQGAAPMSGVGQGPSPSGAPGPLPSQPPGAERPPEPPPPPPVADVSVAGGQMPTVTSLQAEAQLPQQLTPSLPPPSVNPYMPQEESGGVERPVIEAPVSRQLGGIAKGAVGFLKGLFEAGTATQALLGTRDREAPLGIDWIVNQLDDATKMVAPSLGGQAPDFFDKLSEGIGNSLMSIGPGFGAQMLLTKVAQVAPRLARLGGAGVSGLLEGAVEGGNLFGQLEPLVGEKEAARRSLKSFAANAVVVAATDKLGIFGEQASIIRRMATGILGNGLQEGVQYDIERLQMWVPATHPNADALLAHGWKRDGDRMVMPYKVGDVAEAVAIGALIGGPAAAAVGTAAGELPAWQRMVQQEALATGGVVDPQFSIGAVIEAAQNPDTPREGVDATTWTRWSNYLKGLFPEATGGPGILSSQRGAIGGGGRFLGGEGQPTLRGGAEGLPREHYRRPNGDWVIPRKNIPLHELELKDFIGELGGIKLKGEELATELGRLITRGETGLYELHNDVSGLTLQHMAKKAQEFDFITTADKESLLRKLDDSVTLDRSVYSMSATGFIPLIHDPLVRTAYQAVLDATSAMHERTAEQVGEVRHRPAVHAEGAEEIQQGLWTPEFILDIPPNTPLKDVQASALLQSLNTIGEQMGEAAETYLAHGERLGSREEASLQQLMGLLAELDAVRQGVSAAQSRGLGILNDPLSRYTQYLNKLHAVLETAPEHTMGQIARRIVAAKPQPILTVEALRGNPALLEQLFADMQETIAMFAANERPFALEAEDPGLRLGPPLSAEEQALVEAAYHPEGPPRTDAEWDALLRPIRDAKTRAALEKVRAEQQAMIAMFKANERPLAFDPNAPLSAQPELGVPFQLEAEQSDPRVGTPLSAEEQALVDAAYHPTGPALTNAQWGEAFRAAAQERIRQAWIAGEFERGRAREAILPDLQELNRQRDAQRARAMEDWTEADRVRDEAYAQAQMVWAREAVDRANARWKAGMRDYRLFQEELRRGYPGRPVGAAAGPQLPPKFPPRQLTLLDEFATVQQYLRDMEAGRATAAQQATLLRLLNPYQGTQAQLALPTLRAALQSTRPGFEEFFLELWFNAILSNPATHIANALDNTITATWALPERFVAEQFGFGREGHVARGESTAMLYGLTHGIQDSWAVAVRAWQTGEAVSGLGRESTRVPVGTAANVGLDPESAMGRFADFFFNYVGVASFGRLPSRALMAVDEFFKMLNYRMELNALAYRDAVRQGYDGPAFAEHVARIVSSPKASDLQQAAKEFSVLQTFQRPIEPGKTVGNALQHAANIQMPLKWLGLQEQMFPVGRVFIPFVQTPVNISRFAAERTPLGIFFKTFQEDIDAGGARADTANAKIALGTFAMLAIAGFAMSGRVTGRGPEDPHQRAIWLESHPEYGVKFPFIPWISLDRFGAVGMLVGMVADMVQIGGEAHMPLYERAVAAPLYAFLKNITNKTYMMALSRFFDAMSPRPFHSADRTVSNMAKFATQTLAGLAQPSSFLAATARVFDPAEKEARGFIDQLYARIPGWRNDVPSHRTLGGEKVIYGYGFDPEILANTLRAYLPWKLGDGLIYPADREILDNKMNIAKPSRSLVGRNLPPGALAQDLTEAELSEYGDQRLDDRQYEKLCVLAGGNQVEAKKLGLEIPSALLDEVVEGLSTSFAASPPRGTRTLDEFLDWMIQQPEYRDDAQASPGPGGGKEQYFKTVVGTYRQLGLELLLAQDDTVRAEFEQGQIQQQLRQLPVGERPAALEDLREGYREAAASRREGLRLRVGSP